MIDLLAGWRWPVLIVVSHDRALLETMDAIVELTPLGATRYGGNWSHYHARKAAELAAARHDLADAEKRVDAWRSASRRTPRRKARRDGAGQRKRARGDIPRIQLNAMKDRSEGTSGEAARLAERRRTQALADAASARERIEVLQPLSVVLPPTGLPAGKTVLRLDGVSVGFTAGRPVISDLSTLPSLRASSRVAITKRQRLEARPRCCVADRQPARAVAAARYRRWCRSRCSTRGVELLDAGLSIRDKFRRLNPDAEENACRAALARLHVPAPTQPLQTVAHLEQRPSTAAPASPACWAPHHRCC